MAVSTRTAASDTSAPVITTGRPWVIPARARQSVLQIHDRAWKAKIRKVERIEAELDRMWGVIAERVANDPNDDAIPWDPVNRTFIEAPAE